MSRRDATYYADYLKLNELLSLQVPLSRDSSTGEAHDETLFIITHQAYELWFKQVLHELESLRAVFLEKKMDEQHMGRAVHGIHRLIEIQKLLIQQLNVLETMTPLDFLDFRDELYPASGFQSYQFRLMEIRLGLQPALIAGLRTRLSPTHQKLIDHAAAEPSLFTLVQQWLERTPFLNTSKFSFWKTYRSAVEKILERDRGLIERHPTLTAEQRTVELREWEATKTSFEALFDEKKHRELISSGLRRLSLPALHGALFISLYRDQPLLQQPFEFLNGLIDLDEHMTAWRTRHALMAHRMLGTKIGTGGTSGHQYLRQAADTHKIFTDFFNLSTFLIPRSQLPELPPELKRELAYACSAT
jgi:tryptophan 2,3-dioxygenase